MNLFLYLLIGLTKHVKQTIGCGAKTLYNTSIIKRWHNHNESIRTVVDNWNSSLGCSLSCYYFICPHDRTNNLDIYIDLSRENQSTNWFIVTVFSNTFIFFLLLYKKTVRWQGKKRERSIRRKLYVCLLLFILNSMCVQFLNERLNQ